MRDARHGLMERIQIVVLGGLIWLCLISPGCMASPPKISPKSFGVFSGFAFVGSGPYRPDQRRGSGEEVIKHGTRELPLPDRPQIGIQYVFLHRDAVDNERLAIVDLPTRLRAAGITVVQAPNSIRDLMHLYIGGPLFHIRMGEGGHEGIIYNQIDLELLKGSNADQHWASDDYLLVWLK